jgi:hypothetical protein
VSQKALTPKGKADFLQDLKSWRFLIVVAAVFPIALASSYLRYFYIWSYLWDPSGWFCCSVIVFSSAIVAMSAIRFFPYARENRRRIRENIARKRFNPLFPILFLCALECGIAPAAIAVAIHEILGQENWPTVIKVSQERLLNPLR